jgi:hypothetical protein
MRRLQPASRPLAAMFDRAPNLFWDPAAEPPQPQLDYAYDQRTVETAAAPAFTPPVIPPPVTAHQVIPMPLKKTLAEHLAGVDLIIEALEQLDEQDLTEDRKLALSTELIDALAGTREKVDNVHRVFCTFEGLVAAAETEVARLAKRIATYERQRERLNEYVLATMEASGLPKLEGNTVTLTARKNPVKVVIDDESLIPTTLKRYKAPPPPEPNKDMIKSELKTGREVAGAHLAQTTRLERK